MQREKELSSPLNDSLLFQSPLPEPAIGDYCNTTHRIVIISPFPYTLHKLVRELTVKCYDVLVFRYLDDEALAMLPIDLMIMDLSKEPAPAASLTSRLQLVPVLRLVSSEQLAKERLQGATHAAASLSWETSTVEQVLDQVHALLQQGNRASGQRVEQMQHKDLTVDYKRIAAYLGSDRIELTKTEFDILKTLIEARGMVLSRQELMDRVWGDQYFGGSNTVDVHVKSLRHKLGDDPRSPKYIATIRGVGYRMAD